MALVAALGVVAAGAHPTGLDAADLVWVALGTVLVVVASVPARRWSLLVLAAGTALAGVGAVGPRALVPAVVALVAVVVLLALDRPGAPDRAHPWADAVVAALAAQTLARLGADPFAWSGPNGAATVVAGVLVTPVLVSGYRGSPPRWRHRARQVLAGSAVMLVGITLVLGFAAIEGQRALVEGFEQTQTGLDALRAGDTELARAELEAAGRSLDRAGGALDSPLVTPARVVPGLAQQVVAGREMTGVGRLVVTAAAGAARDADLDRLRVAGLAVDLEAVAALAPAAALAQTQLGVAQERMAGIGDEWLVPPLADAVEELAGELAATDEQLETLQAGIEALPWLLGRDGSRRYLVLFANPAEARGGGGFVGSYGILEAREGRLELAGSGRIGELERAPGWEDRTLSGPADFLARYGRYRPTTYFKNVTASPDFPTVGAVLAELYPQAVPGQSLDGVLYLDPFALAALLEVTGPVAVEGLEAPITARTAPELLLKAQYTRFPDPEARADLLEAAARAVFDALGGQELAGPDALVEALAPAARKGRLRLWVTEGGAQDFLDRLGIDGRFPVPDAGDMLSVRTANAAANKLDAYLARTIDYDAAVEESTGRVTAEVTIGLENRAPEGLPDYVAGNAAQRRGAAGPPPGTAVVHLSTYTRLGLVGAALGGEPLGVEAQEELGSHVYSVRLEVPRGEQVTVVLRLEGQLDLGGGYRLTVSHQPLVVPDVVHMEAGRVGGPRVGIDVAPGDAVTTWVPDLR